MKLNKTELKKVNRKDLKELKRNILRDMKWTIKIGNETIEIINEMLENPTKRLAKKILTRMEWMGFCQDTAEGLVDAFELDRDDFFFPGSIYDD